MRAGIIIIAITTRFGFFYMGLPFGRLFLVIHLFGSLTVYAGGIMRLQTRLVCSILFCGLTASSYGDGAVRVGNSIVVAPMDVLQSLEKNKDKILTKNAA